MKRDKNFDKGGISMNFIEGISYTPKDTLIHGMNVINEISRAQKKDSFVVHGFSDTLNEVS
jgi:hypothetical protein